MKSQENSDKTAIDARIYESEQQPQATDAIQNIQKQLNEMRQDLQGLNKQQRATTKQLNDLRKEIHHSSGKPPQVRAQPR